MSLALGGNFSDVLKTLFGMLYAILFVCLHSTMHYITYFILAVRLCDKLANKQANTQKNIKLADEMGPRTFRQPNLKKVDQPWKGRSVSPLINIHSSIKATDESVINIMDIHNSNMDVYNSVMDIHNSVMDIHDLITDIHTCIIEKSLWISMIMIRLWISINVRITEFWIVIIAHNYIALHTIHKGLKVVFCFRRATPSHYHHE